MPPIIHCIRHGQGFHNLGGGNYDLLDPKLTPLGEEQCLSLQKSNFEDQSHISLITASPLQRTIQSALIVFEPAIYHSDNPKTVLLLPDAQETSNDPCDAGSDPDVLRSVCKENQWPVDLSLIKDGYNDKTLGTRGSPSARAIANRARAVRILLREKARELVNAGDLDAQIALVAHGGFLHFFSEDWEEAARFPATGWVNCETRAYTYEHGVDGDEDVDAHVAETMESRRKRGLDYPMLSKDKQVDLFHTAMQAWHDQGCQSPGRMDLLEEEAAKAIKA